MRAFVVEDDDYSAGQPLFGQPTMSDHIKEGGMVLVLYLTTVITMITLIIRWTWIHAMQFICITSFVAIFTRILQWYRAGELEPKFRIVIYWLFLSILALDCVAIIDMLI